MFNLQATWYWSYGIWPSWPILWSPRLRVPLPSPPIWPATFAVSIALSQTESLRQHPTLGWDTGSECLTSNKFKRNKTIFILPSIRASQYLTRRCDAGWDLKWYCFLLAFLHTKHCSWKSQNYIKLLWPGYGECYALPFAILTRCTFSTRCSMHQSTLHPRTTFTTGILAVQEISFCTMRAPFEQTRHTSQIDKALMFFTWHSQTAVALWYCVTLLIFTFLWLLNK